LPLFGVEPALLDEKGHELAGAASGALVLKRSWPGQMRTVYGDHERFKDTYFRMFPGTYFPGDGARRDADGYYWITGRIDDVINVSGHRLGTAEVESALVSHPQVSEAAVVGMPHPIKGQAIYAYVTVNADVDETPELLAELRDVAPSVIEEDGDSIVIREPRAAIDAPPRLEAGSRHGRTLKNLLRNLDGGLAGYHEDRQQGVFLAEGRQQVEPMHVREVDVDQRHLKLGGLDGLERRGTGADLHHGQSARFEQ
jgi:acetyl-CoA synthetase